MKKFTYSKSFPEKMKCDKNIEKELRKTILRKTFLEKIEELKSKLLLSLLIIKEGGKELADCLSDLSQSFDILIKESCQEFLKEILPEERENLFLNRKFFPEEAINTNQKYGYNICREEIKKLAAKILEGRRIKEMEKKKREYYLGGRDILLFNQGLDKELDILKKPILPEDILRK